MEPVEEALRNNSGNMVSLLQHHDYGGEEAGQMPIQFLTVTPQSSIDQTGIPHTTDLDSTDQTDLVHEAQSTATESSERTPTLALPISLLKNNPGIVQILNLPVDKVASMLPFYELAVQQELAAAAAASGVTLDANSLTSVVQELDQNDAGILQPYQMSSASQILSSLGVPVTAEDEAVMPVSQTGINSEVISIPGTGLNNFAVGTSSDLSLQNEPFPESKVYDHVTAVLSTKILQTIACTQGIFLDVLARICSINVNVCKETQEIAVLGSWSAIITMQQKLNYLLQLHEKTDQQILTQPENGIKTEFDHNLSSLDQSTSNIISKLFLPEMVDKSLQCNEKDILRSTGAEEKPEMLDKCIECVMPTVSRSGREIRAHPEYINYLLHGTAVAEEDIVHSQMQSRAQARKRGHGRPAKHARKDVILANDVDTNLNKVETETKFHHHMQSLPQDCELSLNWNKDLLQSGLFSMDIDTDVNFQTKQEESMSASLSANFVPNLNDEGNEEDVDNKDEASDKDDNDEPEFIEQITVPTSMQKSGKKRKAELLKFACHLCSFKSARASHFAKHLLHHKPNTKLFYCKHCPYTTIRQGQLKRHELVHSSKTYSCKDCKYITNVEGNLHRHHLYTHRALSRKEPVVPIIHSCPNQKCAYKTRSEKFLMRHLQTHPEIRQSLGIVDAPPLSYQCDLCPYKTTRKEHYVRHTENVHQDSRPYLCDICGQGFKRSDALTQHKIVHVHKSLRAYPYVCPACNKGFRSQAHLTDHLSTHTKVRPFLCDICGADFKTRSVQRKHFQAVHVKHQAFQCDHCEKSFSTKYSLQRHKTLHDLVEAFDPVEVVPQEAFQVPLSPDTQQQLEEAFASSDHDNPVASPTGPSQDQLSQDVLGSTIDDSYVVQAATSMGQSFNLQTNADGTTFVCVFRDIDGSFTGKKLA